jgi:hypothetical protein
VGEHIRVCSVKSKCLLATVRTLECTEALSDHVPVLLDSGDASLNGRRHPFMFEQGWLHREGFVDIFKKVWSRTVAG